MSEQGPRPQVRSGGALLRECPRCGGRLGEPVSGDLHCYVECSRCGSRFELDDPDLVPPGAEPRGLPG